MGYDIDRYCACGCWHESRFENGELEELAAHVCTYHMERLREYLENLGIDNTPEGQYTLTLEGTSRSEVSHDPQLQSRSGRPSA